MLRKKIKITYFTLQVVSTHVLNEFLKSSVILNPFFFAVGQNLKINMMQICKQI